MTRKKLTKFEVEVAISEQLNIHKNHFNLEKYFGDWYVTGKLGTVLKTQNTKLGDLGYDPKPWIECLEGMLKDSNILYASAAIESIDWRDTIIFDIH